VANGKLLIVAVHELRLLQELLSGLRAARDLSREKQRAALLQALRVVRGVGVHRVNWREAVGSAAQNLSASVEGILGVCARLRAEVFGACQEVQAFLSDGVERELRLISQVLQEGAKHKDSSVAEALTLRYEWCVKLTGDFHRRLVSKPPSTWSRSAHLRRYLSDDCSASGPILDIILKHPERMSLGPEMIRLVACRRGSSRPDVVGAILTTESRETFIVDMATFTKLVVTKEILEDYDFFAVWDLGVAAHVHVKDGARLPALVPASRFLCLSPEPGRAYGFCSKSSGRYYAGGAILDEALVFALTQHRVLLEAPDVRAMLRHRLESRVALAHGGALRGSQRSRLEVEVRCHEELVERLQSEGREVAVDSRTKLEELYASIMADPRVREQPYVAERVGFLMFDSVAEGLLKLGDPDRTSGLGSELLLPRDGSHPRYLTIHAMLLCMTSVSEGSVLPLLYVAGAARYAYDHGAYTLEDASFNEVFHVLALFSAEDTYASTVYDAMKKYLEHEREGKAIEAIWPMLYNAAPRRDTQSRGHLSLALDWWLQTFTPIACAQACGIELPPGTRPALREHLETMGTSAAQSCRSMPEVERRAAETAGALSREEIIEARSPTLERRESVHDLRHPRLQFLTQKGVQLGRKVLAAASELGVALEVGTALMPWAGARYTSDPYDNAKASVLDALAANKERVLKRMQSERAEELSEARRFKDSLASFLNELFFPKADELKSSSSSTEVPHRSTEVFTRWSRFMSESQDVVTSEVVGAMYAAGFSFP
jgi:hypothetical protein